MPTIQQLVRKGRAVLVDKSKSPALDSCGNLLGDSNGADFASNASPVLTPTQSKRSVCGGRGRARERKEFSPEGGNGWSGLCDDLVVEQPHACKAHRHAALMVIYQNGLDISLVVAAGGAVAHVAHRDVALPQRQQMLRCEHVAH